MKSKTDWILQLDQEWLDLIMEAKSIGMDLATIRDFFNENESRGILIEK